MKNPDKEMAAIFYDMYLGCLKFKQYKLESKSTKKINCDEYYENFKFFAEKNINDKNNK